MNTHPITQKIKAKYLRAVNNEMIGNYQHSIVVNIMRRIVKLVFETPDFAIDLPIEPQWRDHYATALCISAYLGYVQYTIVADDTIAHITLTDPYRAQILAATTAPATDTTNAPSALSASSECSECSECSEPSTAPPTTDTTPSPSESSESSECSEPPTPAPSECSECSEPPPRRAVRPRPAIAAANFRLKAVTTASLKGSLCNSRGQGRRGRPQPSDSSPHAKSLKDVTLPTQALPQSPVSQRNTLTAPISTISPAALPPPRPEHPPPRSLSAALS